MNVFLADWRTKEPTNMDPALFDLLWQVYQEVGGTPAHQHRLVLPLPQDQRHAARQIVRRG